MASRPRSSYSAIAAVGLSGLSNHKLNKMKSEMDIIRHNQEDVYNAVQLSSKVTLKAIKTVAELQLSTMIHLRDMDKKLNDLSFAMWDLTNYFKNKDERLAYLRGLCLDLENEVKSIESYLDQYPEYAVYQLEKLKKILQQNKVRVELFNHLENINDVERARNSISSIDKLNIKAMKLLEE